MAHPSVPSHFQRNPGNFLGFCDVGGPAVASPPGASIGSLISRERGSPEKTAKKRKALASSRLRTRHWDGGGRTMRGEASTRVFFSLSLSFALHYEPTCEGPCSSCRGAALAMQSSVRRHEYGTDTSTARLGERPSAVSTTLPAGTAAPQGPVKRRGTLSSRHVARAPIKLGWEGWRKKKKGSAREKKINEPSTTTETRLGR